MIKYKNQTFKTLMLIYLFTSAVSFASPINLISSQNLSRDWTTIAFDASFSDAVIFASLPRGIAGDTGNLNNPLSDYTFEIRNVVNGTATSHGSFQARINSVRQFNTAPIFSSVDFLVAQVGVHNFAGTTLEVGKYIDESASVIEQQFLSNFSTAPTLLLQQQTKNLYTTNDDWETLQGISNTSSGFSAQRRREPGLINQSVSPEINGYLALGSDTESISTTHFDVLTTQRRVNDEPHTYSYAGKNFDEFAFFGQINGVVNNPSAISDPSLLATSQRDFQGIDVFINETPSTNYRHTDEFVSLLGLKQLNPPPVTILDQNSTSLPTPSTLGAFVLAALLAAWQKRRQVK